MITASGSGGDGIRGTATDKDGNVYLYGPFRTSAMTIRDTTNTTYTIEIGSSTRIHSYLVKFNTLGVLQWRARMIIPTGTDGVIETSDAVVDSSSNVYILSQSTGGTTEFRDKDDVVSLTRPAAYYGIAKYNADGTFGWFWSIPAPYNDYEFPLAIDKDDNLIHSWRRTTNGAFALRNRDGSTWRGTDLTSSAIYTAKLNPTSGIALWAVGISGTGNTSLRHVATDKDGNIYVAFHDRDNSSGLIRDVNTSTGSVFTYTTSSTSTTDAFIVKYNSSGTPQWYIQFNETSGAAGKSNEEFAYKSLACDSQGNLYACGTFSSSVIQIRNGDGTISGTTLTTTGNYDAFVVKCNSAGILQWAVRIGSTTVDNSLGIAVDLTTDDVVCGYRSNGTSAITDGLGVLSSSFTDGAYTMKFKGTDGTLLWRARINAGFEFGNAVTHWFYGLNKISTDPYGNVFHGGASDFPLSTVFTKA